MRINRRGQTALVTGAARGIGLVVARDLARNGINICGTDFRSDLLEAEMSKISKEFDVECLALAADVGNETEVTLLVESVYRKWGRVDILINNAGIRRVAPVFETTADEWDAVHSTNLKGQFLCTREVLKQGMLDASEGTIIFLSSGSGIHGEQDSSAYCASKFGVTGFAQSIAKDLKHTKIRTSAIMPGMTWTPMAEESEYADHDVEWLDAESVSDAICFLIDQDEDTIIPEMRIYHRSQI